MILFLFILQVKNKDVQGVKCSYWLVLESSKFYNFNINFIIFFLPNPDIFSKTREQEKSIKVIQYHKGEHKHKYLPPPISRRTDTKRKGEGGEGKEGERRSIRKKDGRN